MLTFFAIVFALAVMGTLMGIGVVSLQNRHHRLHPAHAPRPRPRSRA